MKKSRIFEVLADIASDQNMVGGTRVSAAIVCNKSIIAVGINSYQTHTLQHRFRRNEDSIYLHAEISALSRARYRVDLTKCDIYVVRLLADDTVGLAKPCSGCLRAINHFGIQGVYYSL